MAEITQERVEDRLPELQQLERTGLFSEAEIRAVIRKTLELEYGIQRRSLSKDSFIRYVQYEIELLELIQKRRARVGYTFKKDEIEDPMIRRIQSVFQRASIKWKDDVKLWLSFVVFCRKWAANVQLSKLFSSLLAFHSNKPGLWILAAKWEMEDRFSAESARQLFLRALRFHPRYPKLYEEYFRMELMHAEKLRKEKQEFEKADMDVGNLEHAEEVLKGELARIVYKNSISVIKSAKFHVSLLSIAQLFDFAKDLQREIYNDLKALHTDDPLTWDYVARQELVIKSQPGEELPTTKQAKAKEVGPREERCCAVYEEAVKTLPTEAMWKCYMNFCMERFTKKTSSRLLRKKRLERTMATFWKTHELKLLPELQYRQLSKLLLYRELLKESLEVADAGVKLFRKSEEMWHVKLEAMISSKSQEISKVFNQAFEYLKPQICLPLWFIWAQWSEEAGKQEEVEMIYKRAVFRLQGDDSATMKEMYLAWAYRSGGYKKARDVFKSLQENRPFSVDFFRKMIEFEKEQESCKMENLREYYERALREFGTVDSDLWMDYIKEELNHPLGRPENCGQLYWRAMKMLQGESVEQFMSKHALHQAGRL
ncbi:U3 small nucleolar RNA-associated protein 6 homolog [Cervus elaphus]|uniref:U3 small nucleolar RNA-associated protein 6 homolog n=1 Tax=Cervus canadensis TaxID=1574408 RepID=UPI001C9E9122|nr:U3 small nucleolar RNA-associated protein 6 homolog [Cervus canadensis]XP_043757977.1 U3 small nucleolar RNA-associated protein 6 homolog [Cervus elaphus]